MNQDPAVRSEAHSVLTGLFSSLGQHAQSGQTPAGGLLAQFTEFVEMPLELAQIFTGMAVDLTELVLKSLEEAGIVLVKGLSPV